MPGLAPASLLDRGARDQGVPTWPLYDSFAGVPGLTPAKARGLEAGGRGLTRVKETVGAGVSSHTRVSLEFPEFWSS